MYIPGRDCRYSPDMGHWESVGAAALVALTRGNCHSWPMRVRSTGTSSAPHLFRIVIRMCRGQPDLLEFGIRIITMALFTITTKRRKICNGVLIEPGMTVQVVSPFNNPVTVNGGQAVEDAFMRMFGISLKKANALNMSDLDVKKQ